MLFDKRWEPLTLEHFIAWLEGKPGDEAYRYDDPFNCPIAQYLKACGHTHVNVTGYGHWMSNTEAGQLEQFANIARGELRRYSYEDRNFWTFSAALSRAKALRGDQS